MRTLRLKVRPDGYAWLNRAAVEINQVWNWANETSEKAASPFAGPKRFLTGFDLVYMTKGASACFSNIGANSIQRVCCEFAAKRKEARRIRLRWRTSTGSRRSLGWIPFRGQDLRRRGTALRYAGKAIRVYERELLDGVSFRDGCFAQDAVGDWWLCLPVAVTAANDPAPRELVGVDLGLKDTATTSDGERLDAGTFYRGIESKIAQAQRRGHKRLAKRLHRKAARQRRDALHKFSRKLVNQYQNIVVGDVSSARLAKTRMAKAVLDSGWGMLKTMLQYKGQQAGRTVQIVNERNTTRTCSACGAITGPAGLSGLRVREWQCECGASHDRDVNAARNIAILGSRQLTSVCGNELSSTSAGTALSFGRITTLTGDDRHAG